MLSPLAVTLYATFMKRISAFTIGLLFLTVVPAHSAVTITKMVRNCVNSTTGDARLVSEKVVKCKKGERLIKIAVPTTVEDSWVHVGSTAPVDFQTGHDGDFYIDNTLRMIYGPRLAGVWGTGISMVGQIGPIGKTGTALISGLSAPDSQTGIVGDFYLDLTSRMMYGPKSERAGWGIGFPITGPQGLTGASGAQGPQGPAGPAGQNGAPGGYGGYGSFYDTSTVILTQNVATPIPLNTTQFSSGISIVDGTKISFATSGKFNISFSSQIVKEDAGTDVVSIWLCKGSNGGACTNASWSATDLYLPGSDARQVAAWNFFISATAGEYFQLMISSGGTTLKTKIISAPAQSNPARPEVPGTILTVNQVG